MLRIPPTYRSNDCASTVLILFETKRRSDASFLQIFVWKRFVSFKLSGEVINPWLLEKSVFRAIFMESTFRSLPVHTPTTVPNVFLMA
ncbi:hypothetical protein KIN20_014366 [Parelaphostrongylus tenuis]|uniref:Uncharacterized protein n=1 Tax=Parelaphostrongylus tenuis TaxID=148309 RepID=A0AAD5MEV0_PARTN|nr:hypothetical protein KIN20_014366 [Parelaphostrongylus tenuis]